MTANMHIVLSAVLCGVLVFINTGDAQALTRVLVTIDVESKGQLSLMRQVDSPCANSSPCGLMSIAGMLKERSLSGTFFLNVYEYPVWGKSALRDIASRLQSMDQDVALHTHPQWAYDPERNGMFMYNLEEQTAIIRDGVTLLAEWTGRPVVAHRAGDYAADEQTLEALVRNGIRVDSSLFMGHPRSRLTGLGLPNNLPVTRASITEIPVTVFQREERPCYLGNIFSPAISFRKIDVNGLIDEDEARAVVDAIADADLPFLVVFLHSFSFLAESETSRLTFGRRQPSAILKAILDRVTQRGLPVMTMRDVAAEAPLVRNPTANDIIPRVPVYVGWHRYLWHRFGLAGALGGSSLLIGGVGLFLWVHWRKKNPGLSHDPSSGAEGENH